MSRSETVSTAVAYNSPPGHNHDDNCRWREYVCPAGHKMIVTRQNSCPACDWRGKTRCWCHKGEKARLWPDQMAVMD